MSDDMRLIIVDGLDGVGKDTQGRLIAEYYEKKGENVLIRSHPEDDNFFGKKAKLALYSAGKINKLKASVYYMLDVLRSIRLYYRPGEEKTLIMVRYLMGTAYLPRRIFKFGYSFFEHFVPTSPYMFFLDADPDVLRNRLKVRKNQEIFETLNALIKVRKKALQLTDHWHIIDTAVSVKESFVSIQKILEFVDENQ